MKSGNLQAQRKNADDCSDECCANANDFFPYAPYQQLRAQVNDMCDFKWDCRLDCHRTSCFDNPSGDFGTISTQVIFDDRVEAVNIHLNIYDDEKFEFTESFKFSLSYCQSGDDSCDLLGAKISETNHTVQVDIVDDGDQSQPGRVARPHIVETTGGSITVGWLSESMRQPVRFLKVFG